MQVSQATARVAFNRQQTLVAVLLFLMIVLNYLDRQILSVLAPVMRKELGLSQSDYAFAVNAFLLSYAFMYTGSGLVLDRVGPKRPGCVRGALVCCLLPACNNPRAYGTCGVSILSWVGRAGRMDGGRQDRVREIYLCAKRTRHRHLYHRGGHRRGDCASPDRLFQSQVRMAIRLSCGQCCRAALGPLLALCYRKPPPAFAASEPKRELELHGTAFEPGQQARVGLRVDSLLRR